MRADTALRGTLLLTTLASGLVNASEFDAEEFVEIECGGCHDSSIYTRSDRKVDSLARLNSQVRFCDANLSTGLFDEDIEAVVNYLDAHYYKFSQ